MSNYPKTFRKATKILNENRFIYEKSPHGNLIAEPMDISICKEIVMEMQSAGYFVLVISRDRLIISIIDPSTIV